MKRFIATALLGISLALPAQAEKLSLNAISNYLNGLQTAKGAFTQINGDGTISTGTIYIKRPGRVRFEYNPPEASLVMAGGGQVAVFDARSNQPPEQYPLSRTPLSIILQRNVNLAQAQMVTGHGYDGTSTTVTAQDPENPDYGSIQMVFTDSPVELRQWVITDNAGGQTTVVLGDLEKGVTLPARLFNIVQEAQSR
ncbi:outer membrane lipoprotein carrier protein LolA [Cognatishimia sp. MH4019]|uniref:LolA family protein n=1 Tax=Cognatishimia sp. MH4019 TaxID=2854030 RepID=UPI00351D46CD